MKLLREPLLHFVLAGALLFGAYAWLNPGDIGAGGAARTVRIGDSEIAWLTETWMGRMQRQPTREELRGLVTEYLKEELLAREGRAMGLDENDTIVRRRLAQKVAFLVQDTSRHIEPTEVDLRRFYDAHPERFQTPARVSFTHVFFNPQLRKDAMADAKAALAKLSRTDGKVRPGELGDPLMFEDELRDADEQIVSGQFGKEFAREVFALQPGTWHGPIESGYGLHLVRVSYAEPARRREFSDVKAQVLEDWRELRQREDNERYFAVLLKKYDVVVDENLKPLVGPLDGPIAPQVNGMAEGGVR